MKCNICGGRGHVIVEIGGYSQLKTCSCYLEQKNKQELLKSGLGRFDDSYTFEKFEVLHKWQDIAKSIAQDYANNPEGWLLLLGQPGAGKTHLGVSAMKEIVKHEPIKSKYVIWSDIMNEMENNYYKLDSELYKEITQVDLLYIDDFLKHKTIDDITRREDDLAFSIINSRYVNRKKTIISCQWLLADLFKHHDALARRLDEMSGKHKIQIGYDIKKMYRNGN